MWTPQVIVDGRGDVVGAQPGQIEGLVAHTPAPGGPGLTLTNNSVVIAGGTALPGGADVWLVRYDPRTIDVAVRGSENSGRTIAHRNVVKQLVRAGHWTGAAATISLPAGAPGLSTAVLVQSLGGPILAAVRGG